jgi:hypothetical protein
MREQPYEAESLLQTLIADHPEILGEGEEGASSEWLLVKQEAGIAASGEGSERWSLDHLFLDREGVPTLVEVKRSSDTRARREVVAQMLEYAANGVAYWSADLLQTWFASECESRGADPQQRLEAFGIEQQDDYWQRVKTNLDAERIRLVFVADEISGELGSILEYLNRQMTQTEVFAIEVKQYVDADGQRQTIVPRVIGRTEASKAAKSGVARPKRQWDEGSLLADIRERFGKGTSTTMQALLGWATGRGLVLRYGTGARYATVQFRIPFGETSVPVIFIESSGAIVLYSGNLPSLPPFDDREKRDELRRRLSDVRPGVAIPPEEESSEPAIRLEDLTEPAAREGFIAAINWAFDEIDRRRRSAGS